MSTSTNPREQRSGMALPIALAAIVIVGALITGVFFASTQQNRVGRNSLSTQRAAHAAEVGLSTIMTTWTTQRTDSVKMGLSRRMNDTTIDGVSVKRQFSRVSPTTFWVTATATQGGGSVDGRAAKRLNLIVRLATPDFRIMGPITSRNATSIGGTSVRISGTDTLTPGWDCPPTGPAGAGMVVNDSATMLTGGGGGGACGPPNWTCIAGTPAVKDSTLLAKDTLTYTQFGGFSYDSLTRIATKVFTAATTFSQVYPRAVGTACDIGQAWNWGDTSHVNGNLYCKDYYPIIHLKGNGLNWTLNGQGGGQGILLVDGNLSIAGSIKWTGVILVRGSIAVSGTGGGGGTKIIGAIAAMNAYGGTNSFSGNTSIAFSRCAISQITSRLSTAALLRDRAWADVSY
jgi:hypothetical protein